MAKRQTACAKIVGVNGNTADKYYNEIRQKIFEQALKETPKDDGEFELDESYFGAKRVRGKRGRGAAGKTPVFGLLKRGGKVFVKIVKNCSKEQAATELPKMPIIQGSDFSPQILEKSVIYTDGWKAYDGLVLNGYEHAAAPTALANMPNRVFHSENEFARGKSHVNGIENFWSFAKRRRTLVRMHKFNGCASDKFVLHLKECVRTQSVRRRYNHRDEDLFNAVKKILRAEVRKIRESARQEPFFILYIFQASAEKLLIFQRIPIYA